MPPKKIQPPQFEKITNALNLKFGAHVAASGGVSNAVINARNIGANSFALFLRSPRKWESPPISNEEANKFKNLCKEHGYDPLKDVLPHGSYFINMANPDPEKEQKAYGAFIDDLKRCEQLGIGLYNFHPGSSLDGDHGESIKRLAKNINQGINETEFVRVVVENMAGHGNLIGSNLKDLKDILELIENKDRIGFCIDTCHTFAAGYDITTESQFKQFLKDFDEAIGLKYIHGIHLNDSKAPLGANRDLHERLGRGFLGLEVFRVIANSPELAGIPIVLETPVGTDESLWGHEIKLLEWMIGRETNDAELQEKAKTESKAGQPERTKQMAAYEKKQKDLLKKEKNTATRENKKRKGVELDGAQDITKALKRTGRTKKAKEEDDEEEHKCHLEEKEEADEEVKEEK